MIISEKQLQANCLDALQEAAESIEDILGESLEYQEWYDEIQNLYARILKRYES